MKTLSDMNKQEKSLLLYLETCAVDRAGRVQAIRMNKEDIDLAKKWSVEKFIDFGRICSKDLGGGGELFCHLSEEAWALAAQERKARAKRMWENRSWRTTEEYRKVS